MSIGEKLAKSLFELGSEPNSECQRIQFMGGKYPHSECSLGGLNRDALARFLDKALSAELFENEQT